MSEEEEATQVGQEPSSVGDEEATQLNPPREETQDDEETQLPAGSIEEDMEPTQVDTQHPIGDDNDDMEATQPNTAQVGTEDPLSDDNDGMEATQLTTEHPVDGDADSDDMEATQLNTQHPAGGDSEDEEATQQPTNNDEDVEGGEQGSQQPGNEEEANDGDEEATQQPTNNSEVDEQGAQHSNEDNEGDAPLSPLNESEEDAQPAESDAPAALSPLNDGEEPGESAPLSPLNDEEDAQPAESEARPTQAAEAQDTEVDEARAEVFRECFGSDDDEAAPEDSQKEKKKKHKEKDKEKRKKDKSKDKEKKKKHKDKNETKEERRKRKGEEKEEKKRKKLRAEGGGKPQEGDEDAEGAKTREDEDFIDDAGAAPLSEDEDDVIRVEGGLGNASDSEGEVAAAAAPHEEEREDDSFDAFVEKMRAKKRKQKVDADQTKAQIEEFLQRMHSAAVEDVEANGNSQPALRKVMMLKEVLAVLDKDHETKMMYLDNGLLRVLCFWLEPLGDGSMPNIGIIKSILELLLTYPVDQASLRGCPIIERVKNAAKDYPHTHPVKMLAKRLLDKWLRLIYDLSTNFTQLGEAEANTKGLRMKRKDVFVDPKRARAFIPQQLPFDYTKRPEPQVEVSIAEINAIKNDRRHSRQTRILNKLDAKRRTNKRADLVMPGDERKNK